MLNFFQEKRLFKQGFKLIAAIDEAGRGPLAGPVVAACLVFKNNFKPSAKLKCLRDSKHLTSRQRMKFYQIIKEQFTEVAIGICDNQTIDRVNILQATFLAMKKALKKLKNKPDLIIIDGLSKIPDYATKQLTIVRGDQLVFSIAAASIIAKVTRDQLMMKIHQLYPEYNFNQNQGYGTKLHLQRLKQYGPCPVHRLSFSPVKNCTQLAC